VPKLTLMHAKTVENSSHSSPRPGEVSREGGKAISKSNESSFASCSFRRIRRLKAAPISSDRGIAGQKLACAQMPPPSASHLHTFPKPKLLSQPRASHYRRA